MNPKDKQNKEEVTMTCKICKRQFGYTEDFAELIRSKLDPFVMYLGNNNIICFNCNGKEK